MCDSPKVPLAYPAERARSPHIPVTTAPLCIYDDATGFCPPVHPAFTDHYAANPRDPTNTTPAPWVASRYPPAQ